MAHSHSHSSHAHHDHGSHEGGETRLVLSIALNLLITVAEIVGGIVSGSLALLSDALHNFSDTASLGISLAARRIARRDANTNKTFGYKRAEIVGAFINLVTLVLIALFLIKEAIDRFLNPQPIDGTVMLIVAIVGLVANVLTAFLLFRDSRGSLNIRSAFLHIVADAVSSVGVVVGGLLIMFYDIQVVDPILTLLISLYILYHSYEMLRETIDILMESVPKDIELDDIVQRIEHIDEVVELHHLHVWQLDEEHTALEAHVVIEKSDMRAMETIKGTVKETLAEEFDIHHSTLEFEFSPCSPDHAEHCYEANGSRQAPVVPDE